MTVSTTSSRVVYAGNGSTTNFPFGFKVAKPADLVVIYADATGADQTLSPSQYSAAGFGSDSGGTVTYQPGGLPIAIGTSLTIYREVAATQPASLSNQGAMWPTTIEAALDRIVMIVQGFIDGMSRSLRINPADGTALNTLPVASQRANSALLFDADGQPYAGVLDSSAVSWSTWILNNWRIITSAAQGRATLDAVSLSTNETVTGDKTFSGTVDVTGGRAKVPTRTAADNGTDAASTAFVKAKAESVVGGAVLRSYLAGLGTSNNAGAPNTKIDVAAGICADAANSSMMVYAGGTLDCSTTGANGLDAGSLANSTWYHLFLIGKTDGTIALLASTSLSSPTMPSTYTLKRRLSSFKTNGSAQILGYVQEGQYFRWKAPVLDVVTNNPGTSAISATLASVPTGVRVSWFGNALLYTTATPSTLLVSDLGANDVAPPIYNVGTGLGGSASPGASVSLLNAGLASIPQEVRTNTSAQIRYRVSASSADVTVGLSTFGWKDRRGRDD